jgi:hypothetical protein
MKYLKTFESRKTQYAKNYLSKFNIVGETALKSDLIILKKNNIQYSVYFYNDVHFGACIKIYGDNDIDKEQKELLENMKFNVFPQYYRYEFTFDWQRIKEDDIELAIDSTKYNL